ncbi:iron reductase domain protein [Apiospora arundinis]
MAHYAISSLIIALFSAFVHGYANEPVQYCRYGYPNSEVDFCLGLTTLSNASANAYDLFMRLQITKSSGVGWTAVGTGPAMDGSLMFIAYGDPRSGNDPVLSVRSGDQHHAPMLVSPKTTSISTTASKNDGFIPEVRLIWSKWVPGRLPGTFAAEYVLICYACSRWPGTPIEATSSSLPWIWAWNNKQTMKSYAADAKLQMHAHHAGNGGWGVFYVDMARSLSQERHLPSVPPLRFHLETFGTSDAPMTASNIVTALRARPLAWAHGMLLGIAFLVLFPFGTFMIRSGSSNGFKNHWTIQLLASILALTGIIIGLVMHRGQSLAAPHQLGGVAIALALVVQSFLGWQHHVQFVKYKRRTTWSFLHIWLGRLIVPLGWVNMALGLTVAGHGYGGGIAIGVVALMEILALCVWLLVVRRYRRRSSGLRAAMDEMKTEESAAAPMVHSYDTVDQSDDEGTVSGDLGAKYTRTR